MIDDAGRLDAGAFLTRLLRLDPGAVVRLRPVGSDITEMWAMLPFHVLVSRRVRTGLARDVTVQAATLMNTLSDQTAATPARRDEAWRWPLPPTGARTVETLTVADVTRVVSAAARTLREASEQGVGGRVVGERVVRDALLDHIAIIVTATDGNDATAERVEIPQRLVQAVARMGFLGPPPVDLSGSITAGDEVITVRISSGWIGLDASRGSAWYRPSSPMRLS